MISASDADESGSAGNADSHKSDSLTLLRVVGGWLAADEKASLSVVGLVDLVSVH